MWNIAIRMIANLEKKTKCLAIGGQPIVLIGWLPVTWLNNIWLNFFVESFGLKILSQVTTKLSQLHSNSRNKCQLPEIS